MRSTQKILIAFLTIIFLAFFAWVVLRGESNLIRPQVSPTTISEIEFVVSIPQKALWKNYVTVSVEAIPETECTLTYVSPSGIFHETKAIADSNRLCIWKWKVDETEGKGASRLIFTINDVSETHFMEIRSGF